MTQNDPKQPFKADAIIASMVRHQQLIDEPRRRGVYWVAAALLVLVSLYATEAGTWAAAPYAVAAAICIIQFFRPTVAVWLVIAGLFLTGSVSYLAVLVGDLGRLREGSRAVAMLDFDDSVVFIGFVLVLWAVTVGVLACMPHAARQWFKAGRRST